MKAAIRIGLFGLVRLLVGAHARWLGCAPSQRQRIYFANHTSHLDALVIMAALPGELGARVHPVAARDYWDRSPLRRYLALSCLGAVLVDRAPLPHGGDPLMSLAEVLNRSDSLILFPEGTRGAGTITPFRSGIYHLARRFPDVELVPVYIENLHRVLPKGSPLIVPLICTLRFGAPITLRAGETKQCFLDRARSDLAAMASPEPADGEV